MTRSEIQGRFDNEVASLYSQRDPAWFPDFRYMFSLIPKLLKPYIQKGSVVLDVGAGTGKLSRTVLEAFPEVRTVLVDFEPTPNSWTYG